MTVLLGLQVVGWQYLWKKQIPVRIVSKFLNSDVEYLFVEVKLRHEMVFPVIFIDRLVA